LGFQRTGSGSPKENAHPGELSLGDKLLNTGIGIVTALNRVTVDYQDTQGTYLPGYTAGVGFIGTLKPSAGFTFGSQSDIRRKAAEKGWLTLFQGFNDQYMTNERKTLNIHAGVDLLPELTID